MKKVRIVRTVCFFSSLEEKNRCRKGSSKKKKKMWAVAKVCDSECETCRIDLGLTFFDLGPYDIVLNTKPMYNWNWKWTTLRSKLGPPETNSMTKFST